MKPFWCSNGIDVSVLLGITAGFVLFADPQPLWFLLIVFLRGLLTVIALAVSAMIPRYFRIPIATGLGAPIAGLVQLAWKIAMFDASNPDHVKKAYGARKP